MLLSAVLIVSLVPVLLVALQMRGVVGKWPGIALAVLAVLGCGSTWYALDWSHREETPLPEDSTALPPVSSQACFKCHESHFTSWRKTYHRTMTREATPENVKADFNDAVHHYLGLSSRMVRLRDRFFIDTIDPQWEMETTNAGIPLERPGEAPRRVFSVDRLVGSHWIQQMLHLDPQGRYIRLPLAYHLVEKRWMHINGAFLVPDSTRFFGKVGIWNETCLYCHNTRPIKNPEPIPGQMDGYDTKVGELGISCEACHGAADQHVRAHQNPLQRLAQHYSGDADPTIINPARLSATRSSEVCGRCHAGANPRYKEWNQDTFADPFLAGRDLRRFWYVFYSEAEQLERMKYQDSVTSPPPPPQPLDGRFWGDGTPLTTALEYQGMVMSKCFKDGESGLSCLSCHSMHRSDPNHQVKEGMRTNAACYSCHEKIRDRLVEHTHHAADSPGSLCYNCHMPRQVYSLLDTHRSHRIVVPRVRDSRGTGKPHACNLCHLDKSLGWTSDHLQEWYKTRPEPLTSEERSIASSVLHLTQSDARTRAVVAGAFSWPPAQQASGRDWPVQLLLRTLQHERYEAVRYLAHKSLRSLYGQAANDYDYQGGPAQRAFQLAELQRTLMNDTPRPSTSRYPYLPLTSAGLFADDVYDRLLRNRNDPDVRINE